MIIIGEKINGSIPIVAEAIAKRDSEFIKYPTIHITAAISNISFNLPVRKLINYGFLVLAMNAGLDSGIMDPTNKDMLGLVYATEALLGLDDYCMEYIGAYREGLIGTTKKK